MRELVESLTRAFADPALAGLRGHFHTHVTIHGSPEALEGLPGAHLTVIDLAGTRAQRDLMLTVKHSGELGEHRAALFGVLDELERRSLPVLRVKVEHGSLPTVPALSRRRYREAHLKLRLPREGLDARMAALREGQATLGYALSRNPREQAVDHVIQFVNLRVYEGAPSEADARVEAVAAWLADRGMAPIEVRRETAIIDTEPGHDAWWA